MPVQFHADCVCGGVELCVHTDMMRLSIYACTWVLPMCVVCVYFVIQQCVLHTHSVLRSEGPQETVLQVTALTELMSHGSTDTWIKILLSFMKNIKQQWDRI